MYLIMKNSADGNVEGFANKHYEFNDPGPQGHWIIHNVSDDTTPVSNGRPTQNEFTHFV